MAGAMTELPAAKVTGSTFGSSTVSSPETRRPIALKGAVTTFTSAFLTAVQMASRKSNLGSLTVPSTGTLARMSPRWSLISATMSPRGRPMRRLTSSPPLAGATWSCPTTTSLVALRLPSSRRNRTLYWSSPFLMIHPMLAAAYGSTLGSLKLRSSPTRSTNVGAPIAPISPRMSRPASPPTAL
jgi:hypothetical protein